VNWVLNLHTENNINLKIYMGSEDAKNQIFSLAMTIAPRSESQNGVGFCFCTRRVWSTWSRAWARIHFPRVTEEEEEEELDSDFISKFNNVKMCSDNVQQSTKIWVQSKLNFWRGSDCKKNRNKGERKIITEESKKRWIQKKISKCA